MLSDKEPEDHEERFRFTYVGLVAETFGSKEQAEKTTNSMLRELELRGYKFDVEDRFNLHNYVIDDMPEDDVPLT